MLSKNAYTLEFPRIDEPEERPKFDKLWMKSFVSVVTRCFGWGLPRTSMIPFADCINHHNVDSTYELIHTKYHMAADTPEDPSRGPPQYYTKSKLEMDFSDFLPVGYSADNEEEGEEPTVESSKQKNTTHTDDRGLGIRTMTQVKKITKRKET